jgi:MFS family permease
MHSAQPDPADASVGDLVTRASEQISRLVRNEMLLAQAELKEKGKRAGTGVGLFGAAGLTALYGVGALIAGAIIGLAAAVPAWLAAVIVGVVLLAIAGVAALMGKKEVQQATPPIPEETVASVREDVNVVKDSVKG